MRKCQPAAGQLSLFEPGEPRRTRTCLVEMDTGEICGREPKAHGKCQLHYRREKNGWPPMGAPFKIMRGRLHRSPGVRKEDTWCSEKMDNTGLPCGKSLAAYGLCRGHIHRRRNGSPPMGAPWKNRQKNRLCEYVEQGVPCLKPVRGGGRVNGEGLYLCGMHYQRGKRHGDLDRTRWDTRVLNSGIPLSDWRDENRHKPCHFCGLHLPPTTEFWRSNPHNKDGLESFCKRCRSDREHHLTIDIRWELLAAQGYRCGFPGCDTRLELYGASTYHTDHNHHCCDGAHSCGNCIRGLLCRRCNHLCNKTNETLLRRISPEVDAYLSKGDPGIQDTLK